MMRKLGSAWFAFCLLVFGFSGIISGCSPLTSVTGPQGPPGANKILNPNQPGVKPPGPGSGDGDGEGEDGGAGTAGAAPTWQQTELNPRQVPTFGQYANLSGNFCYKNNEEDSNCSPDAVLVKAMQKTGTGEWKVLKTFTADDNGHFSYIFEIPGMPDVNAVIDGEFVMARTFRVDAVVKFSASFSKNQLCYAGETPEYPLPDHSVYMKGSAPFPIHLTQAASLCANVSKGWEINLDPVLKAQ